jgi:hypothetical protein
MSMPESSFRVALANAMKAIEEADAELADARLVVTAKKAALDRARAAKIELECEFLGRSKTPLIEYAENRASAEPGPETADERQRGPTVKVGTTDRDEIAKGLRAFAADASEPAWRRAPLTAIGKLTNTARATLGRCGVKSVGDLIGVLETDLGEVTDQFPGASWDGVVAALDEYLDEAPGRRNPNPASPPLAAADPFESTGDEVEDALHDAIFPAGDDAPDDWKGWGRHRDAGFISDADVVRELDAIWPERITFVDQVGGEGYTTRGGANPALWLGVLGPGKLPAADLEGVELVQAVRKILRIPEPSGAPALPGKPAEKPVDSLHAAVRVAFGQLVDPVKAGLMEGATDDQIAHALPSLPTASFTPGLDGGVAWACYGGNRPAIWYGAAAKHWPDHKHAALEGDKLVRAVRMACMIPQPAAAKSKPRKPKTAAVG